MEILIAKLFSLWPIGLALAILVGFVSLLVWLQRSRRRYSPLTEDMLRTPAQELEVQLEKRKDDLFKGVLYLIAPAGSVAVTGQASTVAWTLVLTIGAYGLWVIQKAARGGVRLRLAIDGEQYTGLELNYLMRKGAWVYHDIPFQYGNIDHLVISTGGVFTVETKTVRKPEGTRESTRQWKVNFDGNQLIFPHFQMNAPIEQARLQAKHLKQSIKKNLGLDINVIPVVALPGWYIERTGVSDAWVINPKRGGALAKQVGTHVLSMQQTELIANYVESVARSVPAGSKKMDPDASKYYDFWNNRRFEDKKIG